MNVLIPVSIAFCVVGGLLGYIFARLQKIEKKLDRHDLIIEESDEDPLKNWPDKHKA